MHKIPVVFHHIGSQSFLNPCPNKLIMAIAKRAIPNTSQAKLGTRFYLVFGNQHLAVTDILCLHLIIVQYGHFGKTRLKDSEYLLRKCSQKYDHVFGQTQEKKTNAALEEKDALIAELNMKVLEVEAQMHSRILTLERQKAVSTAKVQIKLLPLVALPPCTKSLHVECSLNEAPRALIQTLLYVQLECQSCAYKCRKKNYPQKY